MNYRCCGTCNFEVLSRVYLMYIKQLDEKLMSSLSQLAGISSTKIYNKVT